MIRGYSVRLDWSEDDQAYVASSPEFPGLTGVDADADAALQELREAMEMAIEVLEEDGEPLPAPRQTSEYSGQFRLRVPKTLHALLARQAADEGVSLNTHIATVLAEGAGQTQALVSARAVLLDLAATVRDELTAVRPNPFGSATKSDVAQILAIGTGPITQPNFTH